MLFLAPFNSLLAQHVDSLSANGKTLKEVKVYGEKRLAPGISVSSGLRGQQLDELRGSTLAESLRNVPGVNLMQTGGTISKPVIHGLHSNRIVILNNGVRQEGQQWGAEHAPEIDPFTAKNMEVVKGAASVRYGAEAMGGVILLEPPSFPLDVDLEGAVNLMGSTNGRSGVAALMLTGRVNRFPAWAWRIQSSIKRSGNINAAQYYLGNTGTKELNYSAALEYSLPKAKYEGYYSHFSTQLGILYTAHIGTMDDINARIAVGRPVEDYGFSYSIAAPRQYVVHHLLKLKADYTLKNNSKLALLYAYQQNHRQEFDSRRGDREVLPITDMVLGDHKLEAIYKQVKSQGLVHQIGFNAGYQVNNNTSGTLSVPFIPNFDRFAVALFAIERLLKEVFEWELGVRYDFNTFEASGYRYQNADGPTFYQGNRQFHNLTGSAGVLWKISNAWQLSAHGGVAWRAPSANELYSDGLHHGAGLYEIGDPDLKTEQGYKWITSLKYQIADFSIRVDPYLQYIHQYIFAQPDGRFSQSNRGTFPVFRYRQTNALFRGIDLSASWRMAKALTYQVNTSMVRAKDNNNDTFLPYIPADKISHDLRWQDEINKRIPSLYLAIGHSFTRRQNRYAPQSDYAEPPAAYHLFSVKTGIRYSYLGREILLGITADNIFNTLYKDYMNRYRYYTHDMGRNVAVRLAYQF